MADFNAALKRVLRYEGGYVNDKDDAGGETYMGIARRFHKSSVMWPEVDRIKKNIKGSSTSDMSFNKQMTLLLQNNSIVQKEVARIYKKEYWDKIHLDEVRSQIVAYQLFDTAVNMGVSKAIKLAQRTVGQPQTGLFNYSWFSLIKDWYE